MFAAEHDVEMSVYSPLAGMGLAALVGVVTLLYLAWGLFQARSLVRRELTAYFISPIAYVLLVVFLAVTGWLFGVSFGLLTTTGPEGTDAPWRTMFADERFWLVFLFIPPLLTMRLFAEERSSGTLEMLMTAPLRDWQVVLSKYVACLTFYVILWLPTLVYVPALQGVRLDQITHHFTNPAAWTAYSTLFVAGLGLSVLGLLMLIPRVETPARVASVLFFLGGIALAITAGVLHYHRDETVLLSLPTALDPAPALTTYLGIFLTGAMFLAIGLFVSSLVRDQMVSAIIAIAVCLPFVLAGFIRPQEQGDTFDQLVYFFSVPLHFDRAFTRGVIDTRPVVLYLSVTVFSLFLTVRSLESRRWQ